MSLDHDLRVCLEVLMVANVIKDFRTERLNEGRARENNMSKLLAVRLS